MSKTQKEKKSKRNKKDKSPEKKPSSSSNTKDDKGPLRVHVTEVNRVKIFNLIRDHDKILHGKMNAIDGFAEREAKQNEILG